MFALYVRVRCVSCTRVLVYVRARMCARGYAYLPSTHRAACAVQVGPSPTSGGGGGGGGGGGDDDGGGGAQPAGGAPTPGASSSTAGGFLPRNAIIWFLFSLLAVAVVTGAVVLLRARYRQKVVLAAPVRGPMPVRANQYSRIN